MLLFLAVALGADAQQPAAMEPGEPEIVLPDVILRVDDLSVEKVDAALPGEEELLSPERLIPLPELEQPAVHDPELPSGVGAPPDPAGWGGPQGSSLAAQVVLGAGSMNHLYSLVSLNRVGQEPRFKLRFLHQMLDGIGEAEAGAGYDQRADSLEAGLEARLQELDLRVDASLADREHGLQGQGSYAAKIGRQGAASVEAAHPLGRHLELGARLAGSFATELLAGSTPEEATELLVQPALWGAVRKGPARLVLQTRYAYQSLLGEPGPELQRFGAELLFSLDIKERYLLEARAGWLWSSSLGHLPPFSLSLSGNPAAFISFQVSGGYRVQEVSYLTVLEPYPFVRLSGASLEDNHGWFVDGGVGLSLKRALALQARMLVARNSALPLPQTVQDPVSGLFTVAADEGTHVSTDLRLRWNLGSVFSMAVGVHSEWAQRAAFTAVHAGSVELEAAPPSGRWGGRAAMGFGVLWDRPAPDVTEAPILDLSGHYNLTDAVSLVAELNDLLYPLAGGPRFHEDAWAPFEAPGLRGTLKVQINL